MTYTESDGSTQPVLVDIDQHVAVITLNRPRVKNALSTELLQQLRRILADLRDDSAVHMIVVTGAGGAFCAGADISQFEKLRTESPVEMTGGSTSEVWAVLRQIRKPVVAAVNGVALGGGCELAMACDFIVAAEDAKFGLPEVRLGAIPGAGGTQRIITAMGKAKALRLLLSGEPISASEAASAGLVSDLTAPGEALVTARAIAQQISGNSPFAVALAKDAALASLEVPLEVGIAFERRNFSIALKSDDLREGQAAFLEKRAPNFSGR